MQTMPAFCAIDFGTSNSAIALAHASGVQLVALENGQPTMPTAVFYAVEGLAGYQEPQRSYGRAAIAAYVEGIEGRLMRSMKSILGSTLAAWMGTDDEAVIDAFLDRRIENVMQFEKLKAQAKDAFAKMPDPMDLFGARKG